MAKLTYRPQKQAFLLTRISTSLAFLVFLTGAAALAAFIFNGYIMLIVPVFILLGVYSVFDTFVAFRKQRYEFGESSVFFATGNLFTDRETELDYKNITNVRVVKPFLEYRLFGTGKVQIESAGSAGIEVDVQSVADPYKVFEEIRALLGEQTFSLTYKNLLSQTQPAPLAVALEIAGVIFGAVAAFFFFTTGGTIPLAWLGLIPAFAVLPISLFLAAVGSSYIYINYQDRIKRTYYVYDDVIHYSEGFLTKREVFIPAANLANSRLTQNIIDKFLNLHDVIISCQGQGSEISFRNLRDGQKVERVIDNMINKVEPKAETKQAQPSQTSVPLSTPAPKTTGAPRQKFTMNMPRAMWNYVLLYPLMLLFPPVLIIFLVQQYITAKRTEFWLTEHGVASYYTFLSTKNVEFSQDKITGLVIKRNPLDRYFKTCTVTFWSIGSGSAVEFKHISEQPRLEQLMQGKAGIISDKELETIKPRFSLGAMLKANLGDIFLGAALIIFSVIAASIWSWWFLSIGIAAFVGLIIFAVILRRRYARASLRLGQHTASVKIGVMFRNSFYARLDNVKDITLTKYPLTGIGNIQFNVAGERAIDNGQGGKASLPNRFNIGYMPGVAAEVDGERKLLDALLLHEPDKQTYAELKKSEAPKIQKLARPALKNALAVLIPLHVIIFPLIIFLPASILLRRFWLRRTHYIIENDRVILRYGVIYRRQTSILFTRLDYIKTGQDFLNKVFKNGDLYLYTTGSSRAELTLQNIPKHKEFHQKLKDANK